MADVPVTADTPALLAFGEPRARWVLAATVLGSGLAFIDGTVVNVALPSIGESLDADVSGLQWTINAYTLTLASFILLGGSLGDRFGRRRVFVIGVVWFAVASLACGLAPNVQTLVAARAVQGVGGALLVPGSLAILQSSFRPQDRMRAIGAWSGLARHRGGGRAVPRWLPDPDGRLALGLPHQPAARRGGGAGGDPARAGEQEPGRLALAGPAGSGAGRGRAGLADLRADRLAGQRPRLADGAASRCSSGSRGWRRSSGARPRRGRRCCRWASSRRGCSP